MSTLIPAKKLGVPIEALFAPLGKRFGTWRPESKLRQDGTIKWDKVPNQKANAPDKWMSLDKALKQAGAMRRVALFLATDPITGEALLGLDLDLCRSKTTGEIMPWAREIIYRAQTYGEVSVSGTGVKLIGLAPPGAAALLDGVERKRKVDAPIPEGSDIGVHKSPEYEVLVGNRYSATSFDHLPATPLKFRMWDVGFLVDLMNGLPYVAPRAAPAAPPAAGYEADAGDGPPPASEPGQGLPADAEAVLAAIPNGPDVGYDDWIKVCFALGYTTNKGEDGLRLFHEWSRRSIKYIAAETDRVYHAQRVDRPNPITWGALVHMARANGHVGSGGQIGDLPDLTDMGNSERFLARHGQDIMFCYPSKKWHVWDGRRWKQDDEGKVERLAKSVARELKKAAKSLWTKSMGDDEKEKAAKEAYKWAMKSQAKERLAAIPVVARSEVNVDVTDFDVDPWLVNFRNGTLDLRTGELSAHARKQRITRLIDVVYDSNAAAPDFEKFVHTIMGGDAVLTGFLQRAFGYSLSGDTSEQVLFMMHGDGSNGKTTLLEIIRAAMGDYGRATNLDTFCEATLTNSGGPSEGIARLAGARFVSAAESGEDQRLNERLIKMVTGGDRMNARYLHQNSFEFTPVFKLWFALNHLPDIRGQDHAIWRRVRARQAIRPIVRSHAAQH